MLKLRKVNRSDNDPLKGNPKLFLEDIGYDIDEDSDQPGMWIWVTPSDGCDISYESAVLALEAAWSDAVAQTLDIAEISCETWGSMDFDAQRVAMTLALTGELPALGDLSPDTQMEWVGKVREIYPDIGSKEAFSLADQEFTQNDGVLPVKK